MKSTGLCYGCTLQRNENKSIKKFLYIRESRWRKSCRSCCAALPCAVWCFSPKDISHYVVGWKIVLFFPSVAQELSGELKLWPSVSSANRSLILQCIKYVKILNSTPKGISATISLHLGFFPLWCGSAQLLMLKDTNKQEIAQWMAIKSYLERRGSL